MNSAIKAFGFVFLLGLTVLSIVSPMVKCLWNHRLPTATEGMFMVICLLVTRLYKFEVE